MRCALEYEFQLPVSQEDIEKLRAGFEGIKGQDTSGPVMQNVQQVYAGLTYGKGTLNEAYLNPQDYNRGFNA